VGMEGSRQSLQRVFSWRADIAFITAVKRLKKKRGPPREKVSMASVVRLAPHQKKVAGGKKGFASTLRGSEKGGEQLKWG